MQTRQLGTTNLFLSRIGLGLAALGRPGYITLGHKQDLKSDYSLVSMRQQTFKMLDFAVENGINYLDTARSYGRAEEFLGEWLKQKTGVGNSVIVGSKWGYTYTADWKISATVHEVKEHSLKNFTKQKAESLNNLGGALKLYQVHSATLDSGLFDNKDLLNELARLKDKGIIVGLSLTGAKQAETLEKALSLKIDGTNLFQVVQATWNILERSVEKQLKTAHSEGIGVIIKEALANGRLTGRNNDPEFRETYDVLKAEADCLGTSIENLSMAVVLNNDWADVVLSGAVTVPQLEDNIKAVEIEVPEQTLSILRALTKTPESYWQERSNFAWN